MAESRPREGASDHTRLVVLLRLNALERAYQPRRVRVVSHGSERNRSRDVGDHLGFISSWASKMKSRGHFSLWSYDELFNEAFIAAHDLLKERYDPEKGTVTTFLGSFIWSRVSYAYGKSFGWRYRNSKWRILETHFDTDLNLSIEIEVPAEYPVNLTDRERAVLEMRMGGYSLKAIANHFGYTSPNTVIYWIKNHIIPKFENVGIISHED